MNTCKQLDSARERLSKLAEHEPEIAGLIETALPNASAWPATPPDADWLAETTRWFAAQKPCPDVIIVLGAGSPGEMQHLFQQAPASTRFCIMEKSPTAVASLFLNWEMERFVSDGRLLPAFGDDAQNIGYRICKMIDVHNPPHMAIYDHNQIAPEDASFYRDILHQVHRDIKHNIFNLNTLLFHGPLWQYNALKNLPTILTNPGINQLFDKFQNYPALIVGAGPSLNDALPYIKRNAHKFVILTAATALRPLRAAGIRPDLVLAVDASRKTAPQFATACDDLYLACSTMAYPPALQKFRGIFNGHLSTNPIDMWMEMLEHPKGKWVAAGTVTTTALDLAVKMGCDPIVSVGFDLSFTSDGTTHANQTMYHNLQLNPQLLIEVPGNYAPTVPTTEQFKVYIELLNNFIKTCPPRKYINATSGGARLDGMELHGLDYLDQLAASATQPATEQITQLHTAYTPPDLAPVLENLRTTVEQFKTIISSTQQAARICNRLIMMLKSPYADDEQEAQRLLARLKELDSQFTNMHNLSALLLDMGLWPTTFKAGAQLESAASEQTTLTAIELNRQSRETYEQIAGAAHWSQTLIAEAADILASKTRAPQMR